MNLSFLANDPLNSAVADASNGNVLYTIETPYKFLARRTTAIRDARGETVATFQRRWGPNRVCFRGDVKPASKWLENKGISRWVPFSVETQRQACSGPRPGARGSFVLLKERHTCGRRD